ncbi:RNA polymerase sigma factor [Bacillus sp. FJAT-28004]|uniref:RNA polymerase sigma factor n=1 Tax=Bacillus sp. FJAT-28004 TaxID=1679165 RepID=UPI001F296BAC|nr:RNA polymerase sigma factor [Bacillus sp. FJAT-28004]
MMNEMKSLPHTEMKNAETDLDQLQTVLQRYCLFLTRSPWDAEDLAQDTWLKGLRAAVDSNHNNPEALLLRIAKNTWIDQLRRRNQYHLLVQQARPLEIASYSSSLDHEEALYALMLHLTPVQRTVFLLRDVLNFSIEETAERLNSTTGAIKAALHRAREALHAVRRELKAEAVILPEDEHMRTFLRAMAVAYQTGDLALLVELSQRDITEAPIIVGIAQNNKHKASRSGPRLFANNTIHAQMAA